MTKNQIHEWRDKVSDYPEKRIFRGYWNSREWQVSVFDRAQQDWLRIEVPSAEIWISLRKTLWNKYLRRRIAHKMVARVDTLLLPHGYSTEDLNVLCGHGVSVGGANSEDWEDEEEV
jgi:hypothetical protein